jgi:REP-associated tyrosine transposase
VRPRRPEHLRKFDYLGFHAYFLTFCTYERARLFASDAVVDLVLLQISRAADECGFAVLAYCFMPDHVHLLVEGMSDASDCKAFISRAKQYSGFYYANAHRARLWQRYSFEHVLRDNEKSETAARYILENPVTAGLVERIEDYPYLGSLEWPRSALLEWLYPPTSNT